MEEIVPPEYARERLSVVREVATTGQTIAVEGMTRGRWRRSVFRPMGTVGEHQRCVLAVQVPVPRPRNGTVSQDAGYEVRRAKVDDFGPLATLSERELEVLRLIAEGKTTAEIAKALHRSVKTVEWHRVSLGTKLGAANRVELARIAIQAGLVNLDSLEPHRTAEPAPDATVTTA
ncbi:MAG: response regulator transcription factor [Phycisphaeraceae bacterium]|nr:response regulator transcription factor [Phycisphaeraceae bacterium]MCW5755050.1 response regulator transcription factor [Phycisphaeraceae bacterium]